MKTRRNSNFKKMAKQIGVYQTAKYMRALGYTVEQAREMLVG